MPSQQLIAIPLRDPPMGLDTRFRPGDNPKWTSSLEGVEVSFGTIIGQKGVAKWNAFSTVETDVPIIGLFPYTTSALATTILRMMPTTVKKWTGATWEDITGTALTGDSTVLPQWTSFLGNLVFTNEGQDRPRKWAGSGNTAVLGGTPPFCKAVAGYRGFLFLGNISDDGTFTDVTNGYRIVQFSAALDSGWSGTCDVQQIVIDETPGEIVWMGQSGDYLLIGKNDGIVALKLVGGATRFVKDRVMSDPESNPRGIIAPLSVKPIGGGAYIFLATDLQLYLIQGMTVRPLPQNVSSILQDTLTAVNARTAVAEVDLYRNVYHLFYRRSGTWNNGRISFNYLTGEFYHRAYSGHEFTRAVMAKLSATTDPVLLASTTTLVYQLDNGTDDDGTTVSRYYDIDWNHYGVMGEKYLMGVDFTMSKKAAVRVKVSAARDFDGTFTQAQPMSAFGREVDSGFTHVSYRLPSPLYGTYFKLRFEFFHDGSTNTAEVWNIAPVIQPVNPVKESQLNAYAVSA